MSEISQSLSARSAPQDAHLCVSRLVGQALGHLSKARRELAAGFSILAHLAVVFALISARVEPPTSYTPMLMSVQLIDLPQAEPVAASVPEPEPAEAPKQQSAFSETPLPPPPDVTTMPAGKDRIVRQGVDVSDLDLAGAATAGSGAGGGACNMPGLLQTALRRNRLVQTAVAQAHRGKPIMVWNGDWTRYGDEDGAGLAAVREAIMWEVAFAPEACRTQAMHGLVLLSLNDAPGAPRLVVGTDEWRWTDMLFSRATSRG